MGPTTGYARRAVTRTPLILALLLVSIAAFADPGVTDDTMPDARSAALGGSHAAWVGPSDVLATNVAGLRRMEDGFRFTALTLQTTGPVFDIASVLLRGFSGVGFATLVGTPEAQELLDGVYARAALMGPVAIAFYRNGFGISFRRRSPESR